MKDGGYPARRRRLFAATYAATWLALTAVPLPLLHAQTVEDGAPPMQDIIVTGSRIQAVSGASLPSPTTILDSSTTRSLGIANVGDALLQLPSLLNSAAPGQTVALSPQNIGSRIANLRGLGAERTLILVDGRRFAPSTANGTVDMALIPSAIVNRSDIVTGGASAAYGSDAVAGVINLVTDTRLEGLRAQTQSGVAQQGDNGTVQASLAGGTGFASGRGHIVLAGEYEKNKGQGDYYSRQWSRRETCQLGNFVDPSQPANLIVDNCRTGFLTGPGLIDGGPFADQQFSADGGSLVPFVPGQYRGFFQSGGTGKGENAFFRGPVMVPAYERYSLYGYTDFEVSPAFKPFVNVSYGSVLGKNVGAQGRFSRFTGGGLVLTGENPFVPEVIRNAIGPTGTISVGKAMNDLGNALGSSKTSTLRAVAGVTGELGAQWHYEAYYQQGRTDYAQRLSNNLIPARLRQAIDAIEGPGGAIVCRDQSNGCQPFNPLGIGNFTPGAATFVTGTAALDTKIKQDVVSANISGELAPLPGGPLAVAAGAEYRRDSLVTVADPISQANGFYTFNAANISGAFDVTEGYFEVNAPLLADVPFAKSFALNGAVRRTDYSTSGAVTTWKVGGVWEPSDFLRFRVTRSQDIRAPNISELFSPLVSGQVSVVDPQTNAQVLVPLLTGGNQSLRPETANTTTVGVVITPLRNSADTLTLSVDYYDIKVTDVITSTGATNILQLCQAGSASDCGRVTRNGAGAITLITDTQANLNGLSTRGVDFELNYRRQIGSGSLSFRGLATYVDRLVTFYNATGTSVDLAGQTGNSNFGAGPGVPHFQATSYLTWKSAGGTSITVQNRYIGKGRYDVLQVGPDEAGYQEAISGPPARNNSNNDNSVSSRLYTNLSISQTIPAFERGSIEVYAVVNNLFDRDPPIAPGASSATNGILFDQIGRTFLAGVRLKY
ncbi:outer membrane receptor protein involved in Fe transport [Sphingobium sp. B11D3B]|uniref:TonB-dependent receptor domain-containing protein n=1 Tax=Sphingobium sp. B11D3B TaxID=2940575 RepID=UPI0022277A9B|nr:TonB-dependent receptor [Sphingobium sp. B11D3B]MCW2389651.1 outer membrane receptor protein involved in Fe transport [Sphingobium sp. B11D3B]